MVAIKNSTVLGSILLQRAVGLVWIFLSKFLFVSCGNNVWGGVFVFRELGSRGMPLEGG